MLSKKFRLSRLEISSLGEVFKGVKSSFLTLSLYKNTENKTKFAVICSKKVAKKAVLRNKLRRQLYSSIYKNIAKIKDGYNFIFSFKKIPKDYKDIEIDLVYILNFLKLLK